MLLALWRHFGAYRDDFQVITSESDDELMRDNFQGVTGESDVELMLNHNQLKVGESLQRQQLRQIGAEVLA